MAQDTQTALPGIKRGIAIGVTCSVAVILILVLATFSIRRRRRIARLEQQKKDDLANKVVFEEVWWLEKTKKTIQAPTQVPTETGTSTLHELDGSSETERPRSQVNKPKAQQPSCCPMSPKPDQYRTLRCNNRLPSLIVSPPEH
ncbi:hypothetical protein T440DRAFT_515305 [Plenodomus tracheiphilus IPT5]|uniref:Uncharacterized protein n=1 Tax=Plenodomus tracheiphilus IPT5 TaxID=1408161 RepID=A0A6A7BHE9_9PLEO|nr:hypothetical protein T440DRAFT_515305 [Plenodomus tracheiphilus IPT5]